MRVLYNHMAEEHGCKLEEYLAKLGEGEDFIVSNPY